MLPRPGVLQSIVDQIQDDMHKIALLNKFMKSLRVYSKKTINKWFNGNKPYGEWYHGHGKRGINPRWSLRAMSNGWKDAQSYFCFLRRSITGSFSSKKAARRSRMRLTVFEANNEQTGYMST